MTQPKTLIIDIETSPNLAYVWALFNQNISLSQLVDTGEVLSFAAKWHGAKRTEFHSVYDFDKQKITQDAKVNMVDRAHTLMSEADFIVHFNGKSFDMPHLRREFLLMEYPPPAPHKDIDLYLAAKSRFRFTSNKLDHIAQQLGVGKKASTGGFDLWAACMREEATAWRRMRLYNRQDVTVTEGVYDRIIGWIPNHPPVHLWGDRPDVDACGNCGGSLRREGYAFTTLGKFQRYQCKNGDCGAWSRGKRRVDGVDARPAA